VETSSEHGDTRGDRRTPPWTLDRDPAEGRGVHRSPGQGQHRARERRRRVFVVLLESITLSLLIGLVPPLRPMWYLTAVLLCLLAVYVWLLLWLKEKGPEARSLERTRMVKVPDAAPTAAPARYVAERLQPHPACRVPRAHGGWGRRREHRRAPRRIACSRRGLTGASAA